MKILDASETWISGECKFVVRLEMTRDEKEALELHHATLADVAAAEQAIAAAPQTTLEQPVTHDLPASATAEQPHEEDHHG